MTTPDLPPGLPPLPPVPAGYDVNAWAYRGTNWTPGEFRNYAYHKPGLSDGWVLSFGMKPIGSSGHYIEAVHEPAEPSAQLFATLDPENGEQLHAPGDPSEWMPASGDAEYWKPFMPPPERVAETMRLLDEVFATPEPASGVEARVCEDDQDDAARLRGLLMESVGMLVACMRDSRPPDQSKVEELCGRVNRQTNKPAERSDRD